MEEIEIRNNIAQTERNKQQPVVKIITIGDEASQSARLPNPLLEDEDLILNASLDMEFY